MFVPDEKEVNYFYGDFFRGPSFYSRHFQTGRAKKCGDISPSYSVLSRERISFVYTRVHDARLIIILRNPIDSSWSWILHSLMRKTKRTVEEIDEQEIFNKLEQMQSYSNYTAIIANWLSVYPREQRLITFIEDIADRPEASRGLHPVW